VADVDASTDVVGFTIAEFFPREVMHLQQLVDGFPDHAATTGSRCEAANAALIVDALALGFR
jgi:hypothetical protein